MLQCLIIDDEPLARQGLEEYIRDSGFLQLIGSFDNPIKASDVLVQQTVDLLFLDIQMPRMTGLEFLRSLQHPPLVILTTAYPQYAVEGFELNAIDYLLKPFSFERFYKAALKAKALRETGVQHGAAVTGEADHFFIKSDNKLVRIRYEDILFVEALQNYVAIYTSDKKYITYLTFKGIEEYLPAGRFVRTHKSFIVASAKVESIEGNDIRIGQHHVPISRTERDSVLQLLLQNRLLKR